LRGDAEVYWETLIDYVSTKFFFQEKTMDIVNRIWGKFEVLQLDHDCKVKKLTINPYKQISKQYHMHRSEHWLITKGEATVYLDGVFYSLVKGKV